MDPLNDITSHTPGEWLVGDTIHGNEMVVSSEKEIICTLDDVETPGQKESNAFLIATAPALLDLALLVSKLDANKGLSRAALRRLKRTAEDLISKTIV